MTLSRFFQRLAALSALAISSAAVAQNPTSPGQPTGAPTTTPPDATRRVMRASRATSSISIDGKLSEPAWATAVPSGGFMQSYPNVGVKPTDSTEVRVLYDDAALYIGVRMFDARPDSIAAQLARRDATGIYSDWLHVMIDSYKDRRTAFRFSVNPRGVQKDVLEFDDRNGEDLNWDAVWEVATTVDSLGWRGASVSQIVSRCLREAQPGTIYVLHIGLHSKDVEATSLIVDGLEAQGYRFSKAVAPEAIERMLRGDGKILPSQP